MFAVGEETSKPETSYSYDENFIATPHQITQSQETLFVPLHSVFLSFFFGLLRSLPQICRVWLTQTPEKNTNQVILSPKSRI